MAIAQIDIAHALQTPAAVAVLATIGLCLLWVLAREVRRIPARLLVLMATAFVDMIGLLMIVPLLPFYVERLGEGTTVLGTPVGAGVLVGVVVSAFTVAQLISAPLWGRCSDRFGRRPVLLVALGASALAYLVFAFADSVWLLLLSRVVQGLGGGTVGVIQAYVADTIEPAQRARALGWLSAATNLGVAMGPVLGAVAVLLGGQDLLPGDSELRLGETAPGLVAAAICLCNMAFAARFLPESRDGSTTAADAPRVGTRAAMLGVLTRLREPASRLIWIYAVAIGSFQGISAVLALFLNRRFQVTEDTIGFFYMYIGAISVFARVLLLGPLVDRLGEAKLSRVGVVTLAGGVLALPFTGSLPTLALAVALLPLGTAFTFPSVTALLSRVVGQQDRGLYMGLQQTFGGLARVAAPLFYGFAFDHLGVAVPFYTCAGLVLGTLLLGIGLGRVARPSP